MASKRRPTPRKRSIKTTNTNTAPPTVTDTGGSCRAWPPTFPLHDQEVETLNGVFITGANPSALPRATDLATKFSSLLRQALSPAQIAQIIEGNKTREPGVCHSHDHIDSNEVMLEAWIAVTGEEPDLNDEAGTKVWSVGWDIAILTEFDSL